MIRVRRKPCAENEAYKRAIAMGDALQKRYDQDRNPRDSAVEEMGAALRQASIGAPAPPSSVASGRMRTPSDRGRSTEPASSGRKPAAGAQRPIAPAPRMGKSVSGGSSRSQVSRASAVSKGSDTIEVEQAMEVSNAVAWCRIGTDQP